jgi:hypothetical protein
MLLIPIFSEKLNKLKPEECAKISLIRSKNPTWNY